jgi:hypothetical protein
LLAASALSPTPSEAHGIFCGLVCGGHPTPERAWLDQLRPDGPPGESGDRDTDPGPAAGLVDLLATEAGDALSGLARQTLDQLGDAGLGFSPLLPDDSRPLTERATGLYDWVRGFLFAVGVLGLAERDLSEQGREILRDFAALTRMDLDALEDGDENEGALMELTEFVRVAALLILAERGQPREESQ